MSSTETYDSIGSLPSKEKLPRLDLSVFPQIKQSSRDAIRNLQRFSRGHESFPMVRRAAVMVALFIGREGDLHVLLSTRAATMRSYSGDVALPGGRLDDTDESIEYCARREAWEEVGIPIDPVRVRLLTLLPPFHSRLSNLVVTPVVVLLTDLTLQPKLNPSEVDSIFAHPLIGYLESSPSAPTKRFLPQDVASGKRPYHVSYDIARGTPKAYRMHQFESSKVPVRGFTADILMFVPLADFVLSVLWLRDKNRNVAMVAYDRQPAFDRKAPGQRRRKVLITEAFKTESDFLQAARQRMARQSKL